LENRSIRAMPIAFFSLLALLPFQAAPAQEPSTDAQVEERLRRIEEAIEKAESDANRWWTAWLVGYSAATVVQGAIGIAGKDKTTREDMFLGAATTFLGAMGQIVTPLVPGGSRDRCSDVTERSLAEKMENLRKAEKRLNGLAEREREGRSWKMHAITGAVNLGTGLVVWLGFKRSVWDGAVNFMINTAVTEAQIWTQPSGAIRAVDDDNRKSAYGQGTGCLKQDRRWFVYGYPGGFGIRIVF
jgi:hypothetical protein